MTSAILLTERMRKERATRRGELGFLAFQLVFWAGVAYFIGPALESEPHREELTPTFFVFVALILFSCFAIVISAWLLLLAVAEVEGVARSANELQISYVHLGHYRMSNPSAPIRKIPVRLFRFDVERGFEPAWLLLLGGPRVAVIPRSLASPSL